MSECKRRLGGVLLGVNVPFHTFGIEKNRRQQLEDATSTGIGVIWYKHCTLTNSWVSNKIGLTNSEWTNSIKNVHERVLFILF